MLEQNGLITLIALCILIEEFRMKGTAGPPEEQDCKEPVSARPGKMRPGCWTRPV